MTRPGQRTLVSIAMLGAILLAAVSTTIVATAAPSITRTLNGLALYSWVFAAYLLSMTVTTPLYGKLADLHGRKPIFLFGVGLFLLGAFLCGLATSMEQLILFRFVQGMGAGAIQPVAITVVGDLYPLAQRARIQGFMSMMWALASLTGPPLGGFLVAVADWPWVFWASIPFGLAVALLVAYALDEQGVHRPHQLDWWGAATLAAGVGALLLALFEISGAVESSPLGAGPLILLALGLLGFFLWWEARAPEPLLPLPLFRLPIVGIGCILSFIIGAVTMGIGSYSTLFVQGVLGGAPWQAGLALLPIDLTWMLASFLNSRVILRHGYRVTVALGLSVAAVGAFATSRLGGDVPVLAFALVLGITGLGFGFVLPPLVIAAQSAVGWSQRGVATSASMFFRSIGASVGVAVLGMALNLQLLALLGPAAALHGARFGAVTQLLDPAQRAALPPATEAMLRAALEQSLQGLYLLMTLFALVGLAIVWRLPGGRPEEQTAEPLAASEPRESPVGAEASVAD